MTDVFDPAFAIRILPLLLHGLELTLEATFFGASLAVALGFVLFLAKGSSIASVSLVTSACIDFIRSTPILVQLYFVYFVMPDIGIDLQPIAAGSLVLGIHYACYTAEVFRAALHGVPPGQRETGRALGFRPHLIIRLILVPQMLPILIPGLGNYLIALFKETPALSAITVAELLFTAKIVGAESFRYLEPMTLAGLLYLMLSLISAVGIRILEARLRWVTWERHST